MGKILEVFAEENLAVVPITYRGNLQYREATDIVGQLAKQSREKLDEEGNRLLEQSCDAQVKAEWIYARDCLIAGYRIGILTMMEAVTEFGNLIRHDDVVA